MRLLFFLLPNCWVAGLAQAQPLPTVTDTAKLNFMRWLLLSGSERLRQPYQFYQFTTRWCDAQIEPFDTTKTFRYKLLLIHQADTTEYASDKLAQYHLKWRATGLPIGFFSRADLAAMRQQYNHDTRMSWPTLAPGLIPSHKKYMQRCFVQFTLPLFSLEGRRAVIWRFNSCCGHSDGAQLLVCERDVAGCWQLGPGKFSSWVE